MSELKLRLLSYRPDRDNGAALPAALAALLLAGAAVQLAIPQPATIPPGETAVRAPDWRLPAVNAVPTPDLATRGSLFLAVRVIGDAAAKSGEAEDGQAAPPPKPVGPLGGTFLLGAMKVGRSGAVILKERNGRVLRLAPGGSYRGWQLLRIEDSAALFRKGGRPVRIAYGSTVVPGAGKSSESDSE